MLITPRTSAPWRRSGIATAALALLLTASIAGAAPDPGNCDRSGDNQITTRDALLALAEAVDTCVTSVVCDANGDEEATVADALVLLRVAVSIPTPTNCGCIYYDECFSDAQCLSYEIPETICSDYTCVQCEWNGDCADGKVCDVCHGQCIPAEL